MRCPRCEQTGTRVIDSRDLDSGSTIRRRRECPELGFGTLTVLLRDRPLEDTVTGQGERSTMRFGDHDAVMLMGSLDGVCKIFLDAGELETLLAQGSEKSGTVMKAVLNIFGRK